MLRITKQCLLAFGTVGWQDKEAGKGWQRRIDWAAEEENRGGAWRLEFFLLFFYFFSYFFLSCSSNPSNALWC